MGFWTETPTRWFSSKVDWWLGVVLVSLPVFAIGSALLSLFSAGVGAFVLALLVGVLPLVVLYVALVWPVRYGVTASTLVVRFGLFRRTIPLAEITEVRPSHNPLSSPALSLDRLQVRYGSGRFSYTLISPAERDDFLTMLVLRTALRREGDRLVLD